MMNMKNSICNESNNLVKLIKGRKSLSRYTMVKRLGAGATSTVHKVRDNKTNEYYTCKSIPTSMKHTATRETKVLRNLPKSPRLPNFRAMIRTDEQFHIITDYVDGQELFEWISGYLEENEMIEYEAVGEIVGSMASCIKKLHDGGFVHLDIKLENFILNRTDPYEVILIDFGSALPYSHKLESTAQLLGTRGYSAAETYEGLYHPTSDVWSLAVCAWTMLTGHPPFHSYPLSGAYDRQAASQRFSFPNQCHLEYKSKIPKSTFDLFMRMFHQDPLERPSIDEVLHHKWIDE